MVKISCYKTKVNQLTKAFCQLAQKCYLSSVNTCVITDNSDLTAELDRVLWTYSRKQFIPHATNLDPLPQAQPIYITDTIENPNDAKIIVLINPAAEDLVNFFSMQGRKENLEKIIILFHDEHNISYSKVNSILLKSEISNAKISLFEQDSSGAWQSAK